MVLVILLFFLLIFLRNSLAFEFDEVTDIIIGLDTNIPPGQKIPPEVYFSVQVNDGEDLVNYLNNINYFKKDCDSFRLTSQVRMYTDNGDYFSLNKKCAKVSGEEYFAYHDIYEYQEVIDKTVLKVNGFDPEYFDYMVVNAISNTAINQEKFILFKFVRKPGVVMTYPLIENVYQLDDGCLVDSSNGKYRILYENLFHDALQLFGKGRITLDQLNQLDYPIEKLETCG